MLYSDWFWFECASQAAIEFKVATRRVAVDLWFDENTDVLKGTSADICDRRPG
jgi:hypothetical protein